MRFFLRTISILFFAFSAVLVLSSTAYAAEDYKADYQAEYILNEQAGGLNSRVLFTITLTNLISTKYVKQFSVTFPKTFGVSNLSATDDSGPIQPKITEDSSTVSIDMEFTNPQIGRNTKNTFKLSFTQQNLFKVNGNVWEVMLPTIQNVGRSNYLVSVVLPESAQKIISIAKPKPDSISGGVITWNNPKERTIYAVFGDRQYYRMNIRYNLKNSKLQPVYQDIAFPPDTLYQQIFINSIKPIPVYAYRDDDGNYYGRYYFRPLEEKIISADITAVISTIYRQDILPYIRTQFDKQKHYLLTQQNMWKVSSSLIPDATTVKEIYQYDAGFLSYNYGRLSEKTSTRLGAEKALMSPKNAVCTEFSDVFVALAREKGIYSREMQGYGFSFDEQLRPISLVSDVLHSWPEYYDIESQLWIPVDPTWEHTSGIDYFSSFDLNHIVFVIHGKKPDYPYPVGTYKTQESRDVTVEAVTVPPRELKSIKLSKLPAIGIVNDQDTYTTVFSIQNTGNTFVYAIPVNVKSLNIQTNPSVIMIDALAPYEQKEITISYKALHRNKKENGSLSITAYNVVLYKKEIEISPYIYQLSSKIIIGLGFFIGCYIALRLLFSKRRRT